MREKLRHQDIALACLNAIASLEVRRIPAIDNNHHPENGKGHTVLFAKRNTEAHYKLHYRSRRGVATHNAGYIHCKAAHLGRFQFHDLAPDLSRDAPQQRRHRNPCDISSLLKVAQYLKTMPPIQENHGRSSIKNANGTPRSTCIRLKTGSCSGRRDGEGFLHVVEAMRTERLYNVTNVGIA